MYDVSHTIMLHGGNGKAVKDGTGIAIHRFGIHHKRVVT